MFWVCIWLTQGKHFPRHHDLELTESQGHRCASIYILNAFCEWALCLCLANKDTEPSSASGTRQAHCSAWRGLFHQACVMLRKPGLPVQEQHWEISGEGYDAPVTCQGVCTFVKKIALNDNKPNQTTKQTKAQLLAHIFFSLFLSFLFFLFKIKK